MSWWGKLLGGTVGFMLGGPLGALLGAALGHQLDSASTREGWSPGPGPASKERTQTAFFAATFSVMGHICKADGRVSEDEIGLAKQVMAQMQLSTEQRQTAINLFNEGKAPDFPLRAVLDQFRQECHRRNTLMQMFLELQIHAALADGVFHPHEKKLIVEIADYLGFDSRIVDQLEALIRAQADFSDPAHSGKTGPDLLREAYELLGVPGNASDAEVKKAYRRLMNQHHPDKLVSRGMPEEMIRVAEKKTREIRAAYERVRDARVK